jgi:hypothetical protein
MGLGPAAVVRLKGPLAHGVAPSFRVVVGAFARIERVTGGAVRLGRTAQAVRVPSTGRRDSCSTGFDGTQGLNGTDQPASRSNQRPCRTTESANVTRVKSRAGATRRRPAARTRNCAFWHCDFRRCAVRLSPRRNNSYGCSNHTVPPARPLRLCDLLDSPHVVDKGVDQSVTGRLTTPRYARFTAAVMAKPVYVRSPRQAEKFNI